MKYLRLIAALLIASLFIYLVWVDGKRDFMDVALELNQNK